LSLLLLVCIGTRANFVVRSALASRGSTVSSDMTVKIEEEEEGEGREGKGREER
jgi:hypothetical protein